MSASPVPARVPKALRGILAVGGGTLLSMTLAACYGAPIEEYPDSGPSTCEDTSMDTDGDGYCLEHDCDETSVDIHEGANDPDGDTIDQNCDGVDGVAM